MLPRCGVMEFVVDTLPDKIAAEVHEWVCSLIGGLLKRFSRCVSSSNYDQNVQIVYDDELQWKLQDSQESAHKCIKSSASVLKRNFDPFCLFLMGADCCIGDVRD